MKPKGFCCAEDGLHAEADYAGVGDIFEVLTHFADGEAGYSAGEQIFGELEFAVDGFAHHGDDRLLELRVEEMRVLVLRTTPTTSKANSRSSALIAERPS